VVLTFVAHVVTGAAIAVIGTLLAHPSSVSSAVPIEPVRAKQIAGVIVCKIGSGLALRAMIRTGALSTVFGAFYTEASNGWIIFRAGMRIETIRAIIIASSTGSKYLAVLAFCTRLVTEAGRAVLGTYFASSSYSFRAFTPEAIRT